MTYKIKKMRLHVIIANFFFAISYVGYEDSNSFFNK